MTPEGKVKKLVRELFARYGERIYSYWPVPTGYGTRTLDVLSCFHGLYFAVETKAPGEKLTKKQEETAERIRAAGGRVFVVSDPVSLMILASWLEDTEAKATHIKNTMNVYNTLGRQE